MSDAVPGYAPGAAAPWREGRREQHDEGPRQVEERVCDELQEQASEGRERFQAFPQESQQRHVRLFTVFIWVCFDVGSGLSGVPLHVQELTSGTASWKLMRVVFNHARSAGRFVATDSVRFAGKGHMRY